MEKRSGNHVILIGQDNTGNHLIINGDVPRGLELDLSVMDMTFSIFPVHSVYDFSTSSTLRYLCAVCTALAFVPLVCSSNYCTFCLPSLLLILLLLHI